MSIVKGIISNGLANVVQKIVRIADQLLLVPFFLTHWGAAMYGEWLTLTIIPSVLAFSDLGFDQQLAIVLYWLMQLVISKRRQTYESQASGLSLFQSY